MRPKSETHWGGYWLWVTQKVCSSLWIDHTKHTLKLRLKPIEWIEIWVGAHLCTKCLSNTQMESDIYHSNRKWTGKDSPKALPGLYCSGESWSRLFGIRYLKDFAISDGSDSEDFRVRYLEEVQVWHYAQVEIRWDPRKGTGVTQESYKDQEALGFIWYQDKRAQGWDLLVSFNYRTNAWEISVRVFSVSLTPKPKWEQLAQCTFDWQN